MPSLRYRLSWLALAVGLCLPLGTGRAQQANEPAASETPQQGTIRGQVTLETAGVTLADLSPLVVYLEILSPHDSSPVPEEMSVIGQHDARFVPDFLVVSAGQTIDFPNTDRILHNIFSYSIPNSFDLGLYPRGETRSIALQHPGVVRIYCSIHESMNAIIFVVPSIFHQTLDSSGTFEFTGVPVGHLRLSTWSPVVPGQTIEVDVSAEEVAHVSLSF
jgi:plastocyanin